MGNVLETEFPIKFIVKRHLGKAGGQEVSCQSQDRSLVAINIFDQHVNLPVVTLLRKLENLIEIFNSSQ